MFLNKSVISAFHLLLDRQRNDILLLRESSTFTLSPGSSPPNMALSYCALGPDSGPGVALVYVKIVNQLELVQGGG